MIGQRFSALLGCLLLLLDLTSGLVRAHGLQVFAAADADVIRGSAYFSGGAPASGVDVLIEDGAGRLIAELTSGADGVFHFPISVVADHRVVARTSDGHRAEWLVRGAEFGSALVGVSRDGTAGKLEPDAGGAGPRSIQEPARRPDTAIADTAGVDPVLVATIERAVAGQLRPLREELATARYRAGLQDLLGGIGYIIGLAGIALWWRVRC